MPSDPSPEPRLAPPSSAPIPINSNTQGPLRPSPHSGPGSIMNWFGNIASPPSKTAVSFPSQTSAPKPEPARSPTLSPTDSKRSRKDSSSLSHDEALNISRAGRSGGISRSPESAVIDELSSSPATATITNNGPTPTANRPRSNSRYDKLGLIAAYSSGPSSF